MGGPKQLIAKLAVIYLEHKKADGGTYPRNANNLFIWKQTDAHKAGLKVDIFLLHEIFPLKQGDMQGIGIHIVFHVDFHLSNRELVPKIISNGRDGTERICGD